MATENSNVDVSATPLQQARAATEQVYLTYDLALELETLLAALDDSPDAPKWAWPLHRMAERVTKSADQSHIALLRMRASLEDASAGVSGA